MQPSAEDYGILTAVLAMAVASGLVRMSGFWVMRYVPVTPRVRRMLDAIPGSVIIAAILPGALRGGPVQILAVCAAIASMLVVRNDFVAVLVAAGVAIAARAAGFGP